MRRHQSGNSHSSETCWSCRWSPIKTGRYHFRRVCFIQQSGTSRCWTSTSPCGVWRLIVLYIRTIGGCGRRQGGLCPRRTFPSPISAWQLAFLTRIHFPITNSGVHSIMQQDVAVRMLRLVGHFCVEQFTARPAFARHFGSSTKKWWSGYR